MRPSGPKNLHGSAPDTCSVALLLIDWINDLEFGSGARLLERALPAARATAALRIEAKQAGVPVIYCNDNFGKWRSDFRGILEHCLHDGVRGQPMAELLKPDEDDYFVLKPKHSAFHSTTLDVLLEHLGVRSLVMTGIAGDICVLFTAHDAHMRDYEVIVPQDCIAAETEADERSALHNMAKTCRADTGRSSAIDFARLLKAA